MLLAPEAVAGFALTAVLIELTPGPNMAYLALIAVSEGRKPGLAAVAGVALGLAVMGFAAALGLAALIAAEPAAYQALRLAGVGYLLWLAWDAWRAAGEVAEHAALGSSLGRYFRRGLITNLLNPKAAVFYVAVLPGFLPQAAGLQDAVLLSAIYVAAATAIHAMIVVLAGTAQVWLADGARMVRVRRGLALALVGVAAWMLATT